MSTLIYLSIEQMLDFLPEPNRSSCLQIMNDHERRFKIVQGSTNNHQNWRGGYYDHIQEVMNIALVLFQSLDAARKLPFTLTDALLIVFLHDIEKPWKYEVIDGELREIASMRDKDVQIQYRLKLLYDYNINLTGEQENAMRYVEGEGKDYSNRRRVAGPLAAFCHLCDVTSARIWFDHPAKEDDPWVGAKRVNDSDK